MKDNEGRITLLKLLRSLSLIVLVLFGFISIIASGSDDDDEPEDTPTYSISGTITLASDSTALENITVLLSGDASATALTDDSGAYTFEEVEAGDYTVTPDPATGYTFDSESADVTVSSSDVTVDNFAATRVSAAGYLHFTFPDQKTWFTETAEGTITDGEAVDVTDSIVTAEEEALFSEYTLTSNVVYSTNEDGTTNETVSGYAVGQFIDEEDVVAATPDPDGILEGLSESGYDVRELYAVVNLSNNDGFDNRSMFMAKKGSYNYDLRWDVYDTGYLLNVMYSGKTHFPGSVATPATEPSVKMYNNKWAYDTYMFRKIDVKRPDTDGTLVTFEVKATTESYVDDAYYMSVNEISTTKFTETDITFTDSDSGIVYTGATAISLDQFFTSYVIEDATDANLTYKIVALDDTYLEGWTYAEMGTAYYLVDYDFICQVDSSAGTMVTGTKINYPVRIEIITTDQDTIDAADDYTYTDYGPPAYAIYDEDDNGAE